MTLVTYLQEKKNMSLRTYTALKQKEQNRIFAEYKTARMLVYNKGVK